VAIAGGLDVGTAVLVAIAVAILRRVGALVNGIEDAVAVAVRAGAAAALARAGLAGAGVLGVGNAVAVVVGVGAAVLVLVAVDLPGLARAAFGGVGDAVAVAVAAGGGDRFGRRRGEGLEQADEELPLGGDELVGDRRRQQQAGVTAQPPVVADLHLEADAA